MPLMAALVRNDADHFEIILIFAVERIAACPREPFFQFDTSPGATSDASPSGQHRRLLLPARGNIRTPLPSGKTSGAGAFTSRDNLSLFGKIGPTRSDIFT